MTGASSPAVPTGLSSAAPIEPQASRPEASIPLRSKQEQRDLVSARIGAGIERGHVLDWLRARGNKNKSQIYFTLADELEQGKHIPREVSA